MPRSVRIEYPGVYYHVMARGNRREAIFRDEEETPRVAGDGAGAGGLPVSGQGGRAAAAGLTNDDVARLPGSDARKVAIARLVWEGATMSQVWLAERLRMGSAANVSQQLRRGRDAGSQAKLPAELTQLIAKSRIVA